jgi:hypothetical protein
MKQRISVEDLNQLSEEQKQRLRELWKPRNHDVYVYGYHDTVNQITDATKFLGKNNALPVLGIGQMIELLYSIPNAHTLVDVCDSFDAYGGIIINEPVNNLCDALWSAVKEVL